MLPFYKPEIIDLDGQTIKEVYDAISVQAARAFNVDGSCSLVIPSDYPRSWFKLHTRMILWRYDYEGVPRNFGDTVWFLKKLDHNRSEGIYTLNFVDAFAMLKGRLVAYTAQGTYADKTLEEFELDTYNDSLRADNMIRAFARENIGSLALEPNRNIPSVIIEEDRNLGAFVEKQASWGELEATLVDLTRMSSAKGVDLFYDLFPQAGGNFLLRVWTDLRGVNRGHGSANPLLLTEDSGLISDIHEIEDWTEVASFVYVLGYDTAGSQIVVRAENKAISRLDPFARIETTVNANDADVMSVLADAGVGTLSARRPKRLLTAQVVETSSLVLGRDLDYGDSLLVQVGGNEYECVLDAISTNWQENEEQLEMRLSGQIFISDLDVEIYTPPPPTPPTVNQPPIVEAGPDQEIDLGDDATMAGAASDDGLPDPPAALTNTWSQTSGPGTALFADDTDLVTTVSFDLPGIYVLRLTSTDGDLTTFDEVTVTVIDPNQPPIVDAGPDRTISLAGTLTIDGDVSDDNLPDPPNDVTYLWTMTSGPGTVTFGTPTEEDTTAEFDTVGTYVLRLTASDSALEAFDEMTVEVTETSDNVAPFVNAGFDQEIAISEEAVLIGDVSDDNLPDPPNNVTFLWMMHSGPGTVTFTTPTLESTNASFDTVGEYVIRLIAYDGEYYSFSEITITVTP